MSIETTLKQWEIDKAAQQQKAFSLQQKFPYLVPAGNNALVAAAKNIRIELGRAFPHVKFSVKSSRFSMGDSIDVSWIDGPTSAQVEAIIDKYSAGSFDGMTDNYTYSHCGWTDAFGDAKYVHTRRDYSDKFLAGVLSRVARMWGVNPAPTAEDYRKGRIWNFRPPNCGDFQRECHMALSRHTCYPTAIAIDGEDYENVLADLRGIA